MFYNMVRFNKTLALLIIFTLLVPCVNLYAQDDNNDLIKVIGLVAGVILILSWITNMGKESSPASKITYKRGRPSIYNQYQINRVAVWSFDHKEFTDLMTEKLVTIAKYQSYIEASLAKQILDDFEIKSVVAGQNTANLYSIPAVAEAQLQVLESQAQEALEILESNKKEDL